MKLGTPCAVKHLDCLHYVEPKVERKIDLIRPARRFVVPGVTLILCLLPLFHSFAVKRGAVMRGVDEENCLMCHKYKKMGLFTKDGLERSFYVSENIYAHSVHAKVPCRSCHTDILQIPHRPDHKPVDCAVSCHMKEPFSNREFSHADIKESLMQSTHGPKENEPPEKLKHKPDCKYCHLNPLYNYDVDYNTTASLKRCRSCHEPKGVERAFEHMMYRVKRRESRSSEELVDLCSSCHGDQGLMQVFDQTDAPARGYKEYFHGKAVMRGWGEPANCVDCHSAHAVYPKEHEKSTVNKTNLVQTCGENPSCHPEANQNFAQAAVHVALEAEENAVLVYVAKGFTLLTVSTMVFLILHVFLDLLRQLLNKFGSLRNQKKKVLTKDWEL